MVYTFTLLCNDTKDISLCLHYFLTSSGLTLFFLLLFSYSFTSLTSSSHLFHFSSTLLLLSFLYPSLPFYSPFLLLLYFNLLSPSFASLPLITSFPLPVNFAGIESSSSMEDPAVVECDEVTWNHVELQPHGRVTQTLREQLWEDQTGSLLCERYLSSADSYEKSCHNKLKKLENNHAVTQIFVDNGDKK